VTRRQDQPHRSTRGGNVIKRTPETRLILILLRVVPRLRSRFCRKEFALYKRAPPDGPPPNADTPGAVEKWLRTSASPEKAAELIAFDRPNSTVAASLAAYPAAAQRYHDETPE
jgi:hypothetical protein